MFYGYVMVHDWLYDWGVENGCTPTGPFPPPPMGCDIDMAIVREARRLVLKRAGLEMDAGYRALRIDGVHTMCLVLTTNEKNPPFRLLEKERYVKLKEVLETEDDPEWWVVG